MLLPGFSACRQLTWSSNPTAASGAQPLHSKTEPKNEGAAVPRGTEGPAAGKGVRQPSPAQNRLSGTRVRVAPSLIGAFSPMGLKEGTGKKTNREGRHLSILGQRPQRDAAPEWSRAGQGSL